MKRLLLFLVFLIALSIGAIFFIAIPKIEKNLEASLKEIGFKHIVIDSTAVNPTGISISQITLDKESFSKAENIKINLFWPEYLFQNEIENIEIERINLSSVTNDFKDLLYIAKQADIKKLSVLEVDELRINNIVWDTATPQGALRFGGDMTLTREETKYHIKADLNAQQRQLSFSSQWTGTFDKDRLEIDATFDQMSLSHPLLSTHRGSGWLSYATGNSIPLISGQFDAGNGKLFNIPVSNVSLVIGQEADYYPIIFRTEASGVDGVQFNMDMHYSTNIEKQLFSTGLNIEKPKDFFDYLKQNQLLNQDIDYSELGDTQTSVKIAYEPKKRFADGPFPFDVVVNNTDKNLLEGTFLIYPNSLDIRGTANSKESFMTFITTLLRIDEKNISDDVVRIDSNLKELLLAP